MKSTVNLMISTITNTLHDTATLDAKERWCELKNNCTQKSKEYSKTKKKKQNEELCYLLNIHDYLQDDCLRNPKNRDAKISLNRVISKIEAIEMAKSEASTFRSKCNWTEYGEKNSKMFFALEKNKYMSKNMKTIITEAGLHITDQKSILNEQTKFFKGLYAKDPHSKFGLTRGPNEPYLREDEKAICDAELTTGELFDAVMMLKSNKCPGGDGLTNEWYRKFFKYIATPLMDMANCSFTQGLLPLSTRRGIISLLPKKNKDPRYVKNTRALTMINSDYKIIAKALDNRLHTVLPSLIHDDQTGFLEHRKIHFNL